MRECAGWSVPLLFAYGKNRFFHDVVDMEGIFCSSCNVFSQIHHKSIITKLYLRIHKVQMSRIVTKPTKWHVRPAKTQISLIRVFTVHLRKAMILSYPLSAPRRLWSDWTDAQADLSLRWAHTCHFVGFVTMRLKCKSIVLISSSLYINYWPFDEGIFQDINMSFFHMIFLIKVYEYIWSYLVDLFASKRSERNRHA